MFAFFVVVNNLRVFSGKVYDVTYSLLRRVLILRNIVVLRFNRKLLGTPPVKPRVGVNTFPSNGAHLFVVLKHNTTYRIYLVKARGVLLPTSYICGIHIPQVSVIITYRACCICRSTKYFLFYFVCFM